MNYVSSEKPCDTRECKNRVLAEAMAAIDYDLVREDLRSLLVKSEDYWPADYGNYGPLMVRLAWHSAGSYRQSDGRGGVSGGRQRFEPERSWADNTNLDKARSLLWPIKEKYGLGLSWGDLFVLAGDTAFEITGANIKGFCGGRVDSDNGDESHLLGPNEDQESLYPCPDEGGCQDPVGTTTMGLIYVNPEGPHGQPIPEGSALDIRSSFGRMGMNDEETVALVGGGHAVGKTHGACPHGAGSPPNEDPINPWAGNCGSGKGMDTFTSGFEVTWTTQPTTFDNEYYQSLVNYEWDYSEGPGGHQQWHVSPGPGPIAPTADLESVTEIGMLTADVALVKDPIYKPIVEHFARNETAFSDAFADAWYKLMTRDMGPVERCLGGNVPPPQDWQYPLPSPPSQLANFDMVKLDILSLLLQKPTLAGSVASLAWQCSSSLRVTDNLGGCNGARVRLSPQIDWQVNSGLDLPLSELAPIKQIYGDSLSWADLIILAGNTALEKQAEQSVSFNFCGGRTDAEEDDGYSTHLETKTPGNMTLLELNDYLMMKGFSARDFALLNAAGYAVGNIEPCEGFFCQRDPTDSMRPLSNIFFTTLLSERWQEYPDSPPDKQLYVADGSGLLMTREDLYFLTQPQWKVIAEEYAIDNNKFLADFAAVWTRISNADRYDGPLGNICP